MSHLPTLGGLTGPPIPFPSATLTHLQVGNGDDEQSTLTRGKITTGSDPDMITPPIAIIYKVTFKYAYLVILRKTKLILFSLTEFKLRGTLPSFRYLFCLIHF